MALASYAGARRRRAAAHEDQPAPVAGQGRLAGRATGPRPSPHADGGERWEILGDPAHKIINANLFRVDEALALYAAIAAPVLAVVASDDSLGKWWKGRYTLADFHERLKSVPDARVARVEDAGHMLHHDQPARVAALIEDFLGLRPGP